MCHYLGVHDGSLENGRWIDLTNSSQVNTYGVVAHHYHQAAIHAFPDTAEKATYWWGFACAMCQAGEHRDDCGSGPYTMGELRHAITEARHAATTYDARLYGPQEEGENLTFIGVSCNVLQWFKDESDDFAIPTPRRANPPGTIIFHDQRLGIDRTTNVYNDEDPVSAKIATDEIEQNKRRTRRVERWVEKEHGAKASAYEAGGGSIPSLALMSLRCLHDANRMLHTASTAVAAESHVYNNETTTPSEPQRFCQLCGEVERENEKRLVVCSACKVVCYCSVDCQRQDWSAGHRSECLGPKSTNNKRKKK
jgi:hypothetical protein